MHKIDHFIVVSGWYPTLVTCIHTRLHSFWNLYQDFLWADQILQQFSPWDKCRYRHSNFQVGLGWGKEWLWIGLVVPPPPLVPRVGGSNPRRVTPQTETSARGWGTYVPCNISVGEAELLHKESALYPCWAQIHSRMRGGSKGSVGVAMIASWNISW